MMRNEIRSIEHVRPENLGISKHFRKIQEAVIVVDAMTQQIVL
jgi:hypothetical protein